MRNVEKILLTFSSNSASRELTRCKTNLLDRLWLKNNNTSGTFANDSDSVAIP